MLFLYFFPLGFGYFYASLVNDGISLESTIASMLYLTLCFFIYFLPLFAFQPRKEVAINLINRPAFRILCISLIVGGGYSVCFFIPKAIYAIQYGASEFRQSHASGNVEVLNGGVYQTIAVGFSSFFGLNQLLAFIVNSTKAFGRASSAVSIFLMLSSSSYVFNSFAFAGRDGIVFWLLSLIFCYVFVGRWMKIRIPTILILTIFILFCFGLYFFIKITINRFDSVFFIFSYGAQQLHNFNSIFSIDPPLYEGWNCFREILLFFGVNGQIDSRAFWDYYLQNGVSPWTFSFFIGSFLKDFGKIGVIIFLMVPSGILLLSLAKRDRNDTICRVATLDGVFSIYLYAQVGFMGIFYFKHLSLNMYLLAFVFFILLLRVARFFGLRCIFRFPSIHRLSKRKT